LIELALLALQYREVHRSSIDPRGRTGLEPRHRQPSILELLRKVDGGCLSGTPASDSRTRPDVNATAQEGAGRDYNRTGAEASALQSFDTMHRPRSVIE